MAGNMEWITIVILVTSCGLLTAADANVDVRTRLVRELFDESYIHDLIPICNDEPVKVKVGMALRAILDVDEPSQIVSVIMWLRLLWTDCRLAWNTTKYPIDQLIVSSQRVWIPDITLYDSSTGEGLEKVDHYRPLIYPDGQVFLMAPLVITFSCKMDVTYFPYDQQRCKIKFASWSHDGHEMDVTNRSDAADTAFFIDNGEWDLLGAPSRRDVIYYPCCPVPFPEVTFYLVIQRQHLYYFFNLVMPCALITVIALLAFCLPPESGEKISLGITVLLSLCVFLLMVSERMPATSETIPLIAQYFAATIVLASMSCGMTVVVLNVHHRGQDDQKVPYWVRRSVIQWLGKLMLVSPYARQKCNTAEDGRTAKESQLNPLLNTTGSQPYPPRPQTENHTELSQAKQSQLSDPLLDQILGLLRVITDKMAASEETDRITGEWRQVAMVLDRLFFIINTILVTVVSLVILLRSPSHTDWRDLDSWDQTVLGSAPIE